MTQTQAICVIIAAKNAATTIRRAVASALAEPETAEVVVVDDGSTDTTSAAAQSADDGSRRLRVLRFEENRGPAAARNEAITRSSAPLIAVLDADDFLLPGRFRRLLADEDWDLVADNIAFVDEARAESPPAIPEFHPQPRLINLEGFIEGNISKRGVRRGEIGFLKPVMRRAFLESNGLRYHEDLRLGEDYDLYARALVKGARYRLIHACGYCAVVRANSLSGRHRTEDLRRLYEADRAILDDSLLLPAAAALIRRHEQHIRARYELRRFLDLKNGIGPLAAIGYALAHPGALPAIAGGILTDKTERFRHPAGIAAAGATDSPGLRYLLSAVPVSTQR